MVCRSDSTPERVRALDALRAVCALVVMIGHFGGPPVTAGLDRSQTFGYLLGGLYNNLWNGPAAVIAFFVISGFCIHYPFAASREIPSVAAYGVRRLLRIALPLAVAMLLSPLVGVTLSLFHASILWSLFAELVYYLLYPGLLAARRAGLSWRVMWAVTGALAVALAAITPGAREYAAFGPAFNWLIGLPCWLAGCELAERAVIGSLPRPAWPGGPWLVRAGVWAAAIAASILRFHTPVGYPWTLNLFAVLVWYWVGVEIEHARRCRPGLVASALERTGGWSYSLYLVHVPAQAAWIGLGLAPRHPVLAWLAMSGSALVVSYAFARVVERPAHALARRLALAIAGADTVEHVGGHAPALPADNELDPKGRAA